LSEDGFVLIIIILVVVLVVLILLIVIVIIFRIGNTLLVWCGRGDSLSSGSSS